MTSAWAVYDTSYEQRTPYLTAAEFTNAPTAQDVMNLIAGTAQANATALTETIGRASSWVDQFTCGAWGTLCATQNAENGRIWGSRDGTLRVHTKYWPILSVDAFSYSPVGWGFNNAASITPVGNIWIEPQEFLVSPNNAVDLGFGAPVGITTTEYTCSWLYSNGWPNTTLATSASAGSTSIQPTVITGILPGTTMTIFDLPNDEPIKVAASYVPGAPVVPLTAPTQFAHATTATVTNLPPAIKQAAIWATVAFIKQRGSGALVVSDMGAQLRQQTGFSQNSGSDLEQAMMLLRPFKMTYVGY